MSATIQEPEVRPVNATIIEAAEYAGVSIPTLRRHIDAGQIQTVRFGRAVRIPWSEVERYAREGAE